LLNSIIDSYKQEEEEKGRTADHIFLLNSIIDSYKQEEKEKGRTADHIFLLNSIIDSYKQKRKKKVYAAFIDLKKAYGVVTNQNWIHITTF
jgi:hypothetical protein